MRGPSVRTLYRWRLMPLALALTGERALYCVILIGCVVPVLVTWRHSLSVDPVAPWLLTFIAWQGGNLVGRARADLKRRERKRLREQLELRDFHAEAARARDMVTP